MNTLTIGLLAVGGLALTIILIYGVWSIRKNKLQNPTDATEQFLQQFEGIQNHQDTSSFAEPVPMDASLETQKFPTDDDSDTAQKYPNVTDMFTKHSNGLLRRPALNPLIDSLIEIKLPQPVYGKETVSLLPKAWRIGSKPFSVEGFNLQTQEWEFPMAPAQYSAFQAGVQLANRSGPLNEIELSDVNQIITQLSEHLQCDLALKDMPEEIAKARDLDEFASALDVQIGFTLRSKSVPWKIDSLYQTLQTMGFSASALTGHRVLLVGTEKAPILHLVLNMQSALSGSNSVDSFRLFFEVPHVASQHKPYRVLCEVSQQLAGHLDGVCVDEQDIEIQEESLGPIEQDLALLYQRLQERGFPAGSPLALRLFS